MQLPSEIMINGVLRTTVKSAAHDVAASLLEDITKRWRNFPRFLETTLDSIKAHFESVGSKSTAGTPEDEAYDFLPFRLALYDDAKSGWIDPSNVCSAARARLLALKIEERGYLCSFSEIELTVTLPLKLRGE